MQVGEVIFIIALNCIVIFILYTLQQKSLEKRIRHLKKEVQDLEDLVAAIIEEFEEVAENTGSGISEVQSRAFEVSRVMETPSVTSTEENDNFETENAPDLAEVVNNENVYINTGNLDQTIEQAGTIEAQDDFAQSAEYSRPVSDPKHRRILDLWEQGVSIGDIAKQLGTGRGEVQLILGIYRRSS